MEIRTPIVGTGIRDSIQLNYGCIKFQKISLTIGKSSKEFVALQKMELRMDVKIESSWQQILAEEFEKEYFVQLTEFVRNEYRQHTVFPLANNIFAAFNHTPFDKVKVVIIGQDPYHDHNQANGLSFSVNSGVALPPSLLNIYKELESDIGKPISRDGDLTNWATQGVLLINSTLTVRAHSAGSHQRQGWEQFTDNVIKELSAKGSNIVFILWGAYAIGKGKFIDSERHLILTAPHPSPLSSYRGFFGCKHFSKANQYLIANGKSAINW